MDSLAIAKFLADLNQMANETRDISFGLKSFLKSVCIYSDWPIGHAYILDDDGSKLISSKTWYLAPGSSFDDFVRVSESASFEAGKGLPGRVLESGRPHTIRDVMSDPNFPRNKQAKNLGVKGAFAIPIRMGNDTVGVAEFFAPEEAEANDTLMELMLTAASQVARVFERDAREKATNTLIASFEGTVLEVMNGVMSTSQNLTGLAENLQSATEATTASTRSIAETAGQTSGDVSSVAAATSQLTDAIQELEVRTQSTANKVNETVQRSGRAREDLQSLSNTANTIESVRDQIQVLAKQTHMLSLNASIEAARAGGDAGRAFSIVAREVQELAKARAEQTSQIGERVTAIHDAIDAVSSGVDNIIGDVNEINGFAQSNLQSLEQQKAASHAINLDAESAASGTSKVSSEVETIAMTADETSETASKVNTASQTVESEMTRMKDQMQVFLSEIKGLI